MGGTGGWTPSQKTWPKVELKLTNRPVPSISFQVTHQQDPHLALVSRLFSNTWTPPGYKPAPDTSLPNNHQSGGKQKLSLWVGSQHQPIMLTVIMIPQSDVYPLLGSINACLKLGWGSTFLSSCVRVVGSPSLSVNKETLMQLNQNWFLDGLWGSWMSTYFTLLWELGHSLFYKV